MFWLKSDSREQLGLLLMFMVPRITMPDLLDSVIGFVMVPRDFNLLPSGIESKMVHECKAFTAVMDLTYVIIDPTYTEGHTLDLVFILGCCDMIS